MFAEAKENGFKGREIVDLSEFFSNAGAIVNFYERFRKLEVDESVQDDVILKPQWLLKTLALFIYDEELHEDHLEGMKDQKKFKGKKLIQVYRENGIIASSLIERLFESNKVSNREAQFVLFLCESMLVMCKTSVPESLNLNTKYTDNNKF